MNELTLNEQALSGFEVNFTRGSVQIVGYNEIYQSLTQLSNYLESVKVTEDTISQNKKLVARIAKATKEMNQARIENKRKFMEPFDAYEEQVKTLTRLVKDAEDTVRQQIRDLEESQREQKEAQIRELFDKRKRPYQYARFMEFEDFLKPKHLNKSTSINTVELEMAEWMKATEDDITTLDKLAEQGNFDFPEAMHCYMKTRSVSETVQHLFDKKNEEERIEKEIVEAKKNPRRGQKRVYVNLIISKENFKKIEPILEGLGIEYSCA